MHYAVPSGGDGRGRASNSRTVQCRCVSPTAIAGADRQALGRQPLPQGVDHLVRTSRRARAEMQRWDELGERIDATQSHKAGARFRSRVRSYPAKKSE